MKYLAQFGFDQIQTPPGVPKIDPTHSLNYYLGFFFNFLLTFAVIFALVVIILSGIAWVTSEGDKEKLTKARQRIIFTIVGLLVIFLAAFIVRFAGTLFGVPTIGD